MVKYFCDKCGKELKDGGVKSNGIKLSEAGHSLMIDITTSYQLCDECLDAVKTLINEKNVKLQVEIPDITKEEPEKKDKDEELERFASISDLKKKQKYEQKIRTSDERKENRERKAQEFLKKEMGVVSTSNPGTVKEGKHRGRKCTTDHEMVRQYYENSTWSVASVATRMGIPESTVGKDFGILKKAGVIRKERPKDVLKEWCPHCQYRGMTDLHTTCDYILITGHRRPGPNLVSDCIVYEPGEKIRTAEALK